MVYVVDGKQPKPFPPLEYIEPIIAVLSSEGDCYALQDKYSDTEVSWEARKVQGAGNKSLDGDQILHLTHTTFLPLDYDTDGNPIFGIMESPVPEALFFSQKTAEREAPDYYLQKVRLGEVNLRGAGELLG
ncbi:hypothetical protein [Glutamicibacter sp. NPDC087344]|uniref:hypothetical protein n=1 Tax=Glutamicibacter sp. NPDC087344 TaxID=3363994 RepID=UPI003812CA1D